MYSIIFAPPSTTNPKTTEILFEEIPADFRKPHGATLAMHLRALAHSSASYSIGATLQK